MSSYPPVPVCMRVGLRAVLLMALLVLSAAIGAYAPVSARASSLLHSFNVTYTTQTARLTRRPARIHLR